MKRSLPFLTIAVVILVAGCDAVSTTETSGITAKSEVYSPANGYTTASALVYNDPALVAGQDRLGSTTAVAGINNPALWNYYRFCGLEGQAVTIAVRRITGSMDPTLSLYAGESNTTTGLRPWSSTNPDLTFLAFRDDELPPAVPGPWGDPHLADFVLPVSGTYTLAIYDWAGSGAVPYQYRIEASGFECVGSAGVVDLTGALDIMPGSSVNPIHLRTRGVIPVALYGSDELDVTDINVATIEFAGAAPHRTPAITDVNGDGHADLMMHFRREATNIAPGDTDACLSATGTDGATQYHGCDSITVLH